MNFFKHLDLTDRKVRRNLIDQDKVTENVLIFTNYGSVQKVCFVSVYTTLPEYP